MSEGRAIELVKYALHLRMHGERAPGGSETWAEFDREAEAFLRSLPAPPSPAELPPPAVPCADGFHWIGQGWAFCDDCGLPAWEHPGIARSTPHPETSPFSITVHLEPWTDSQRLGIARMWEHTLISHLENRPAPLDRCDPVRERHREPHVGCTLTDKI